MRPSRSSVKDTAARCLVVSSALGDDNSRGPGKSGRRRLEEGNESINRQSALGRRGGGRVEGSEEIDEEDEEFDDEYVLDEEEDEEEASGAYEDEEEEEEDEDGRSMPRLRVAAEVADSDIMTSGSAKSAGRTGQVRDVPAEPLVMMFSEAGEEDRVGGRGDESDGGNFVAETWRGLGSGRSGSAGSLEANGVERGGQVTTAASVERAPSATGGYFDDIDAFDEHSLRRRIMEEASLHARRGDAAAVEERVQELQRLGLQPGPRLWHLSIVSRTANDDLFGAVGGWVGGRVGGWVHGRVVTWVGEWAGAQPGGGTLTMVIKAHWHDQAATMSLGTAWITPSLATVPPPPP